MSSYEKEYLWAKNEPESFWRAQAENIDWFESPKTILKSDENGIERWFSDGVMNTSWLALDYHCKQGRGDNTALIYDSPVTGNKRLTLTESYAIKLRKLPVCCLPKALKKATESLFTCR